MSDLIRGAKRLAKRSRTVSRLYRQWQLRRQLSRNVAFREALGFRFNGSDPMQKGVFEPAETLFFEKAIGRCAFLVNIGANTGYYVLKALARRTPVLAFEPNAYNQKVLLRNISANDFGAEVHILPIALSDTTGILPMYGDSTGASLIDGWAGQKNANLVPVNTFDNVGAGLIAGRKCLVLIDIEGAEYSCLKGGSSLISSDAENIFIVEIAIVQHQPEGVAVNPHLTATFRLFLDQGYKAFTATAVSREVIIEEVEKVQATAINTFGTHNFVFMRCQDDIDALLS